MMTRNAAEVMRWQGIGSLVVGGNADIAIVDQDPAECPVEMIKETRVLRTLVGGAVVHDSGHLRPATFMGEQP